MPVALALVLGVWQRLAAVALGAVCLVVGREVGAQELTVAGAALLAWAAPWPGDLVRLRRARERLSDAEQVAKEAPEPVRRKLRDSLRGDGGEV